MMNNQTVTVETRAYCQRFERIAVALADARRAADLATSANSELAKATRRVELLREGWPACESAACERECRRFALQLADALGEAEAEAARESAAGVVAAGGRARRWIAGYLAVHRELWLTFIGFDSAPVDSVLDDVRADSDFLNDQFVRHAVDVLGALELAECLAEPMRFNGRRRVSQALYDRIATAERTAEPRCACGVTHLKARVRDCGAVPVVSQEPWDADVAICGRGHSVTHHRCARPAGHDGSHEDAALDLAWDEEFAE